MLVIDNAHIWTGDGAAFDGHVVLDGGVIRSVDRGRFQGSAERVDLAGAALSPGMIDLMTLGGFGCSILHHDPLDIARHYVKLGVTSCMFCSGTLPWDRQIHVGDNVRTAMAHDGPDAARVLGLYLEGPFQHPELTGASLAEHALPPTLENVRRVLDAYDGVLPMINVSPGTDGDVDAVHAFCEAGKIVSMAHSDAPAEQVQACVEAGTSVLGHIWNNNSGLIGDSGVQQPTIEHVALTDERVRYVHMICDGQHVHPVMVRLVVRCRDVAAICLVTDAVPLAGAPDGRFVWDDGRTFYKKDGVGRTDKGKLCGSGLLLPDHFRNFVKYTGLPPHRAISTVTLNPAASIGRQDERGLLAPGRVADLVAWDDRLVVRRVWRAGVEVSDVSEIAEVCL